MSLYRIEETHSGSKREVLQFHYTNWPDFGVPSTPRAFLHFLQVVRDSGVLNPDVGPAIVHCSAGIGRSGTFCLVDSCLLMVRKDSAASCIIVIFFLELMRDTRLKTYYW